MFPLFRHQSSCPGLTTIEQQNTVKNVRMLLIDTVLVLYIIGHFPELLLIIADILNTHSLQIENEMYVFEY